MLWQQPGFDPGCVTNRVRQPKGYVATIVGGVTGGVIGTLIGVLIASLVLERAIGGMAAIAYSLIGFFLALCLGTGFGAGIALAVRRHSRPVLTGVLAAPTMVGATYAGLVVTKPDRMDLVFVPLLFLVAVLALAVARAWALAVIRTPPQEIREE